MSKRYLNNKVGFRWSNYVRVSFQSALELRPKPLISERKPIPRGGTFIN